MNTVGRNVLGWSLAAALLAAGPALAEDKVQVSAEVVYASNDGNVVDPGLAQLKDDLARGGHKFSSVRSVSKQDVTLEKGKDAQVTMRGARSASMRLLELKQGAATVAVKINEKGKQLVEAKYTLARGKSTIVATPPEAGGVTMLILSPPGASAAKPRRALTPPPRPQVLPVRAAELP